MSDKPTYEALEKRVLELEEIELKLNKTKTLLKDEVNWRRLLIEESRDAIVILDQNAKVYDANSRFADMLGYSKEEVYQLHAWDWDVLLEKDQIMELAKGVDAAGHHFETQHRRKDGRVIDVELSNNGAVYRGQKLIFCICRDISERKQAEKQREELIARLRESLAEIKILRGILPICSFCKKVRDDKGYWEQVDIYIEKHLAADISHSVCPECFKKHYPDEHKQIFVDENSMDGS
ncbi:MAG: PAS domain S-box protein [Desulfobacterales bacterium]